MVTYLSIDLDFWREFPYAFIRKVLSLGVPVAAAYDHHDLLSHMSKFDFDRLINIDCHSDLDLSANLNSRQELDCGNWVNFVKESNRNEYLWIYPRQRCIDPGRGCLCHQPSQSRKHDPFNNNNDTVDLCGWQKVGRRHKSIFKSDLTNVCAVGICLSLEYLPHDAVDRFEGAFRGMMCMAKVCIRETKDYKYL